MHAILLTFIVIALALRSLPCSHATPPAALGSKTTHIKLGLLYEDDDESLFHIARVMGAAVANVNSRSDILPDALVDLKPYPFIISDGDPTQHTVLAAQNASAAGVFAIVGPAFSAFSMISGAFTALHKIPMCLPTASTDAVSNQTLYPNFVRLTNPDGILASFPVTWMYRMGWRKMAVVYDGSFSGGSLFTEHLASIRSTAATLGMNILSEVSLDYSLNSTLDAAVNAIKNSGARIVYLYSDPTSATMLWMAAYAAGLVTKDYVWVASDGVDAGSIASTLGDAVSQNHGVFSVAEQFADTTTAQYQTFQSAFQAQSSDTTPPNDYTELWWDCAFALFWGFDQLLRRNTSLSSAMLTNPDYTPPTNGAPYNLQPFTNTSIFSTGEPGLVAPYVFENGLLKRNINMLARANGTDIVVANLTNILSTGVYFSGSTSVPSDTGPTTTTTSATATPTETGVTSSGRRAEADYWTWVGPIAVGLAAMVL
ncbi:periplasmic binding protein-like I [Geranomyces variabilis]|nr:periplasmic binding protein-like I [Geranomyces variabilis]KAJ3135611.1 hypothetical protein HDU90_003685 [Geranomyces variabilis]